MHQHQQRTRSRHLYLIIVLGYCLGLGLIAWLLPETTGSSFYKCLILYVISSAGVFIG